MVVIPVQLTQCHHGLPAPMAQHPDQQLDTTEGGGGNTLWDYTLQKKLIYLLGIFFDI